VGECYGEKEDKPNFGCEKLEKEGKIKK